MTLVLSLSGDAAELAPQCRALLGRLGTVEETAREGEDGADKGGNRLAVAAIVLMLPSTLADTLSLVERSQVIAQVGEVLAAARHCDGAATLKAGDKTAIDLSTASVDEVMNALSAPIGP